MTPEDVVSGQYYRLLEPEWATTFNQGTPPTGMKISYPDKEYFLEWGTVFKASDNCDYNSYGIATLTANPPLIRDTFIVEHIEQFELVAVNK